MTDPGVWPKLPVQPDPENAVPRRAPLALLWMLAPVLVAAAPEARAATAEEVATFVATPFYEGVPRDVALSLGGEACPELLAWLGDPEAGAKRGNAIEAIGLIGCAGGYEALAAYAASAGPGEVDRATFRALRATSSAMGHLASTDDRALAWLLARTGGPGARSASPAWHFRHHQGARLARDERRRALGALATSGRPEAAARLTELTADPSVAAEASEGLALMRAVAREGEAALDAQRGREVNR